MTRAESKCELCGSDADLQAFDVAPKGGSLEGAILTCGTCFEQLNDESKVEANNWRCLNESMWSTVPAVQVVAYRMLNQLKTEGWPQPFFYSKSVLKATSEDVWYAIVQTAYFKQLGKKFDKQAFFSSEWDAEAEARLKLDTDGEKADGYVGMVYGNYYLHIDYNRNGFHYSEKLLISENQEDNTTEIHMATGPYPSDFADQQATWNKWVKDVKRLSEKN